MSIIASDVITDALQLIGVYGPADTLSTADANAGIRWMNRMLDSWSNEHLMVPNLELVSFAMTPGVGTYATTLLSSGRPIDVSDVYLVLSNVTYPIELIRNPLNFDMIGLKQIQGVPDRCFYDNDYPTANFNFWMLPNANYTAYVRVFNALGAINLISDNLQLPPGYDMALTTNLAVYLAPLFGVVPTPDLVQNAKETKGVLKRQNVRVGKLKTIFDYAPDPSNTFIYKGF
jgi:hypothetical protein